MTKENGLRKNLNSPEIHVDRGLELMLETGREIVKPEEKTFQLNIKLFKLEMTFEIKKRSRREDPCKQHL